MLSKLTVSFSPHIGGPYSTRRIMGDVIIALVPAMLAGLYFFRGYALILIPTCVLSCVVTEWLCNLIRQREKPLESLGDLSAVITGIILALSLPPAIPYWAAIIGSVFAVAVGKMVFGGLGANVFNPAMVGRAFLTASFGILMTTWTAPATIDTGLPKVSANRPDAMTQATPLGWSKQAIKTRAAQPQDTAGPAVFVNAQLKNLFIGSTAGCLGETSKAAILLGAVYLLIRQVMNWRIPLAVLLSTFVFGSIGYLANHTAYISPLAHLVTGGILFGAFFIATDPVTAPLTNKGAWLFGAGIGALTILIRVVGEYPEGVMYSVLIMNGFTPLIDRLCKVIPVGGKPNV
ncbi:MAG: RnfABCDGE type electron transport complex subunit D [Sedimentisphaerales bacterium]|nr:RnfABCDGE type electron transport complex subunit D [Sedimentisphaerales bacterium]